MQFLSSSQYLRGRVARRFYFAAPPASKTFQFIPLFETFSHYFRIWKPIINVNICTFLETHSFNSSPQICSIFTFTKTSLLSMQTPVSILTVLVHLFFRYWIKYRAVHCTSHSRVAALCRQKRSTLLIAMHCFFGLNSRHTQNFLLAAVVAIFLNRQIHWWKLWIFSKTQISVHVADIANAKKKMFS